MSQETAQPTKQVETPKEATTQTPPTTAELLAKLGDLNQVAGTELVGFGGGSH